MNSLVNGGLSSITLIGSCVLPIVMCLQPTSDHFQPFLDALSMQIESKSLITKESNKVPKQAHFGEVRERSFAFSQISPNRVSLYPNKLPLYKSKRPIESGLIESNTEELKLSLKYLSSLNRFDPYMKQQARQYIFNAFKNFGLKFTKQNFKAPYVDHNGVNIIGIRPGSVRSKHESNKSGQRWPANDRILVIGAHYDTVANTSGLNDNGSGIGVMLEMIRLLDYFQCETKFSLIFVAFDLEELGAIGSKYFVHEYLIPNELNSAKYKSQFKGAIIMDTLLNFDIQPGTQDIPNDIHQNVPQFSESIKFGNYSGDFLAMFARTNIDLQISKLIEQKWINHDSKFSSDWQRYKLKPVPIETLSRDKVATYEDLQRHVNVLRSDHLHFWYHNHSSYPNSLSAVLLTDTGPFRGYMRYCYHKMCDDSRFLTENNVNFVKKTVDVLIQVALEITEGRCFFAETLPEPMRNQTKVNHRTKNGHKRVRKLNESQIIDKVCRSTKRTRPQLAVKLTRRLLEALGHKDTKIKWNGANELTRVQAKRTQRSSPHLAQWWPSMLLCRWHRTIDWWTDLLWIVFL